MPGFAQNCIQPKRNHHNLGPLSPKHSKTRLYPICRSVLRKERGSAAENVWQPKNPPGRWLKRLKNAILLLFPLRIRRPPVAEWFPAEPGPRSGVRACPKIERELRRDAIPSRHPRSETANPERIESCRSRHRIAIASAPAPRSPILDFLP